MSEFIPPKLAEIVDDFSYCVGQEKLEYLLEFAEQLPPLPSWLQEMADDSMEQVHECISPVFVHGENEAGHMMYYFDAPPEAPTARGFASLLMQGINGSTPEQVLQIPDQFYLQTGLQKVLTGQRLNGIGAFLRYMKRIAAQELSGDAG
jgi:cysteine desulfuration protein SufE